MLKGRVAYSNRYQMTGPYSERMREGWSKGTVSIRYNFDYALVASRS